MAKKQQNPVIDVVGTVGKKISQFLDLRNQLAELQEQYNTLELELKEKGTEIFLKSYDDNGEKPDNFIMKNTSNQQIMFLVLDAYAKIDEASYKELQKEFGNGTCIKETVENIDDKIIKKHKTEIVSLLKDAKFLTDEEKASLLKKTVSYKIAPGTIDQLKNLSEDLKYTFTKIKPSIQLKPVA